MAESETSTYKEEGIIMKHFDKIGYLTVFVAAFMMVATPMVDLAAAMDSEQYDTNDLIDPVEEYGIPVFDKVTKQVKGKKHTGQCYSFEFPHLPYIPTAVCCDVPGLPCWWVE
jgi:hypothetical protein